MKPHLPVQPGARGTAGSKPIAVQHPRGMRERLWLLAALVVVPIVVFFQQFTLGLEAQTLSSAPRALLEIEEPEEPGIAAFTIRAKLAVWMQPYDEEVSAGEVLEELEQLAITRAERLRLALIAGELLGPQAALERLEALEREAVPGGNLAGEIAWFKQAYGSIPHGLPHEVAQALVDRHGWFAQVALTQGLPPFDRQRQETTAGMGSLGLLLGVTGLASIAALVAGIAVLVVLGVRLRRGDFELRLEQAIGGPVYLELFVLFAGGFALLLSMRLIFFGFSAEGSTAALAVQEVMLWMLVAALAWPLFRRVPWSRFAWDVGLHRGEGVRREVWAGVCGYLASIPILLGLVLLMQAFSGEAGDSDPTGYPLFESPKANSWLVLMMGVLSAVVWAPLVEEIVFRGALQRYLRPRLKWWGAVLATALVFGLIHPYTTAGLVQVAVGGVLFGFLREWRGSLIAPITAHFLHNGSIMAFTVLFLAAMG